MTDLVYTHINTSMFSEEQIKQALHYYIYDKQKKKDAVDKYKKSNKGRLRQQRASMRYYYKNNHFYILRALVR